MRIYNTALLSSFLIVSISAFTTGPSAPQALLRLPQLQAQKSTSVQDCNDASVPTQSTRRMVLFNAAALLVAPAVTNAVETVVPVSKIVSTTARVQSYPCIEYLEPMYEFKLSVDALQSGVQDPQKWPFVLKRLEKFFKGTILSEKNFYFGVGLQYMNDIKYDAAELPNYVLMDKESRYNALDNTMKNLEGLKGALAKQDAQLVNDYAKDAQVALASWFAMVPENDYKAVQNLFVDVKKADLNRDGRLSDEELELLSPEERTIWKKRVEKFG